MKIAFTARLALAFTGLLLLQPVCNAEQKEKASSSTKPQENRDKVSYSIGADIGNNLKKSDLDLNPAFLTQGIKDAFSGKTVLTEEEMKDTLQKFQTEMQAKMMAKQKAAGEKNKAESDKFLEENKKKEGVITTASGLQYKIVKAGDGPKPKASDTVSVSYRGTLINGTEFDKSKEPVTFQVEGVIPGWVEALQLMPVGSKWQLFIPPALAYGEQAPPMIGPNQALVFDVELLEIKKAEKAPEGAEAAKPAPEAQPAK
jgi:FKBP-type peptidyl-prolyl cis-trans isomerase FklB